MYLFLLLFLFLSLFLSLILFLFLSLFTDTLSGELDRSFKVRGGSIDTALALKDATRHKQPTGSGAWLSSRTKDDLEASMSFKKRGIFREHTDRSTIVTDLGGLPEQDIPAVVVPVEEVAKVTSSALIQTPTQAYLANPVQPVNDSWELKTQRAEEQRRKNRLLNTSLGSLKDVGGGAHSSMTRLNQINSGMPESFTNNHQTFLAKQFPAPAKRRGQSLSSIKAPRSGRDIPASPATSKIPAEPAPPVKVESSDKTIQLTMSIPLCPSLDVSSPLPSHFLLLDTLRR